MKKTCRFVQIINGREWICVREEHEGEPEEEPKYPVPQYSEPVHESDKHRMVLRYPNR